MISLVQVVGKLRNVNLRAELHGEETIPAVDLKIAFTVGGDFLNTLEAGLKEFVFMPSEVAPDLITSAGAYTKVRFPKLGAMKHGYEGAGYQLRIDYGFESDIVLYGVDLSKISFAAQEGGSVAVGFTAACKPDAEKVGLLAALISHEITFTLSPPAINQAEMQTNGPSVGSEVTLETVFNNGPEGSNEKEESHVG